MTEEEQLVVQYFEYIDDHANVNPNDEITYPPVAWRHSRTLLQVADVNTETITYRPIQKILIPRHSLIGMK